MFQTQLKRQGRVRYTTDSACVEPRFYSVGTRVADGLSVGSAAEFYPVSGSCGQLFLGGWEVGFSNSALER